MTKRMKRVAVVVAVGALLIPTLAAAHHSFAAEYDGNKPIVLRGVVTKMLWSNPHGHLYIDVKGQDGKPQTWELETNAPAALYRRGVTKQDLPVGKEVIVRAYLAKDGSATANATSIKFVDTGREIFAGSEGTGAPERP